MFRTALALLSMTVAAVAAERPNVVFILADDLGWTDLGCQGSKYYESPQIDRMAATGMRFTDGYTCGPNCQPTRAALISGQYGPRTGVYTVGDMDRFNWRSRSLRPVDNVQKLPTDVVTLGQSLKAGGYATGYFGKWHLGEDPEHHPAARGFDEAIVSMGRHFDFKTNPPIDVPEGTYLADFLTDKAVDFLGRHKDEPFFLELAHFGVHSPYEAKPELVARFRGTPPAGGHHDPVYAAMIASVDESVGRVLAKLDELCLAERTLVIFSSDNGGVGGYAREGIGKAGAVTDNAPLRGGKGMLYEGGVRVPYVFRWPGRIAAGAVSARPINSVDLFPTLLAVAGVAAPAGPLDGESYLPTLTGDAAARRSPLFWHFPGYLGAGQGQWRTTPAGAIRDGDWKLHEFFEDGRVELYDLRNDVGERHDLAADRPEKAAELLATLRAWRKSVGAKLPTPNDAEMSEKPKKPGRRAARKAAAE